MGLAENLTEKKEMHRKQHKTFKDARCPASIALPKRYIVGWLRLVSSRTAVQAAPALQIISFFALRDDPS